MADQDFFSRFSRALATAGLGAPRIVGGADPLFYGIQEEDKKYWNELIRYGDDQAIKKALEAKKSYLLTHVIGNPNDPMGQLLRNSEAAYGNIFLHNRMINSHDESVLKLELPDDKRQLLISNQKGSEYLLRYYELKKENARKEKSPEKAQQKLDEIRRAILAKDKEGKTPLLLACKNCNQNYALRLIALDVNNETLNLADAIGNRTPLHIACILGLTEVVLKLIELGADKTLLDKQGHNAFYYLTSTQEETVMSIREVLDSVNFFYGRYFSVADEERIVKELYDANQALRGRLANEIASLSEAHTMKCGLRK